jgi:hypothetical protein
MTARRFRILCDEVSHHAMVVADQTMHEALISWLERHPGLAFSGDEVSVVARDEATGEEIRFRLTLDMGGTPT